MRCAEDLHSRSDTELQGVQLQGIHRIHLRTILMSCADESDNLQCVCFFVANSQRHCLGINVHFLDCDALNQRFRSLLVAFFEI